MSNSYRISQAYQALRHKAEQLIRERDVQLTDADQVDLARLAHELEVQQVELELQNDELRRSNAQIEASRREFSDLYEFAPVAFLTLDTQGMVLRANKRAGVLLDGSGQWLIGRYFRSLVVAEDRGRYRSFLRQIAEHRSGFCELRLAAKNGAERHVQLSGTAKKNPEGAVQWHLALNDISERIAAEEQLRRARSELEQKVAERTAELDRRNRQLARLTTELTLAEQRERRRMAEILHDHLQQMLAGARLNLEAACERHGLAEDPALTDAVKLVKMALDTSRTLSADLSPPVLYMHGLSEALKWQARWMETTHKLQVTLEADPAAEPQQEELKVLLFQSVRELLFNAVKHAGTDRAVVEMQRRDERIRITVSDRGAGFDPESIPESRRGSRKGFGLFSIHERLTLLGGDCHIESRQGEGTLVTLTAPLQVQVFDAPEQKEKPAAPRPPMPRKPAKPASRPEGDAIRVLLVDDHRVMRQGLSELLSRYADIVIAGEAADGGQAVEQARRIEPDVVLMDIAMPVMDGIEATRIVHAQQPGVKIIGLSMHDDDEQADAMYKAGAVGLISKSSTSDTIVSAVRQAGGREEP